MGLISGVVLLMADLGQDGEFGFIFTSCESWIYEPCMDGFIFTSCESWIYEPCMDERERAFGYRFMGLFLGFMDLIY